MIHYNTLFLVHPLTGSRQISYNSVVSETSILLPPPSVLFQNVSTPSSELRRHGSQC